MFEIREANIDDTEELLAIYEPYVSDTAISFEYEVPSYMEFRSRIAQKLKRYPYLVGVLDGSIIGYAYASPYISRAAYDWDAEATIYLRQDMKGRGFGRALYEALEDCLRRQNVLSVYACIATIDDDASDEHLTNASMHFHERMGYKLVGTFPKCGYKFGKWYDMIWMEKELSTRPKSPADFVPYPLINLTK